MYIGAYLLPEMIKNKKTKAAVGALFKITINGFKNNWNFLNVPASVPTIIAETKAIAKPISVLNSDQPNAM